MKSPENLRQRLLRDLKSAHDDLDGLVSRFDLGENGGLKAFLLMHEAALKNIPLTHLGTAATTAVGDLLQRARLDLATLGVRPMVLDRPLNRNIQPLAVDYVIGGSRLGAEVLKRRWQASPTARSGSGTAYMNAPRHLDAWRSFCEDALTLAADTPYADNVVRDAADIFALFMTSAEKAYQETPQHV